MSLKNNSNDTTAGFTLIELSIVLVIIGLIVGGVLVGRDLISAAEIRAQITQIEKYNQAVNTFRGKYNALPGDMESVTALRFGFRVPSDCINLLSGGRDGNNFIHGYESLYSLAQIGGETGLFWEDLSMQRLIAENFPNSAAPYLIACSGSGDLGTPALVATYLPISKIGSGNFVYVYESNAINWFGIEIIYSTNNDGQWPVSGTGIKVIQAYQMDKKIDDAKPTTGTVLATYIATGNLTTIASAPNTATSGGNATSCYDTTTQAYSITYNNGTLPNCALSFKMQ